VTRSDEGLGLADDARSRRQVISCPIPVFLTLGTVARFRCLQRSNARALPLLVVRWGFDEILNW